MAQIDPSITAGIGGGGSNMLSSLFDLARTGAVLQQNRLLSQEANSRARMGQLAQASTNPDGSFDSTTYVKHILGDPVTAPFAPQVMNQFAEKGLIDANTTAQNLNNWKARYDTIASVASAVGQDTPSDTNPADTKNFIGRVSDQLSLKNPDGTQMFTAPELTAYLTHALSGVKTNADLKSHVLSLAQGSLTRSQLLENVGTQPGLGPNGEPKLYFFNRLAQGAGAGGNAGAAGAFMAGAGTNGQGFGAAQPGGNGGPGGLAVPGATGVAAPQTAPGAVPGGPSAAPTPSPAGASSSAQPPSLTLGPSAPEQEQLKALPGYISHVNSSAATAQNLNFQLDKLDQVRTQFKQGGGAGTYAELGKLMQAAGVRQDWVDKVANGSLPASQTFSSLSQQVAVNLMKQQLLSHDNDTSGAGRLLQSEWSSYISNKPNWEHDPRTLDSLLGFMRKQNGLATAKANALQLSLLRLRRGEQVGGMRSQADVMSGFEPYWMNNLYSRGIISQGTAKELGAGESGE
jgi:hypothetical protein